MGWGEIYCRTWWGNPDQYGIFKQRRVIPSPPAPECAGAFDYLFTVGRNLLVNYGFSLAPTPYGGMNPPTFEGATIQFLSGNIADDDVEFILLSGITAPSGVDITFEGYGTVHFDFVSSTQFVINDPALTAFLQSVFGTSIGIDIVIA